MEQIQYSIKYLQCSTFDEAEGIDKAICEKLKIEGDYEKSGTTEHSKPAVQIGEFWYKEIGEEAQEKCPELFEGKVLVESLPEITTEING